MTATQANPTGTLTHKKALVAKDQVGCIMFMWDPAEDENLREVSVHYTPYAGVPSYMIMYGVRRMGDFEDLCLQDAHPTTGNTWLGRCIWDCLMRNGWELIVVT
jgi:hypothetical protein